MVLKYFVLLFSLIALTSCVNHDLIKRIDCEQSDLMLLLDSTHEATSCSVPDGFIKATAHGGRGPYSFSISGAEEQASGIFTAVAAGSYSVLVKDGNGCEVQLTNISIMAEDLSFSADVGKDDQCIDHNGTIVISIADGNFPFAFSLDGGTFSATDSFPGLKYGAHSVIVRDNSDCSIQLNIDVPRDTTGTSWTNDILPIIKTSCALNGCHDGKTRFDYRVYENAKKDMLFIKTKTQDKTMPFDGTIPQEQIDLIACWVDDGGPEN